MRRRRWTISSSAVVVPPLTSGSGGGVGVGRRRGGGELDPRPAQDLAGLRDDDARGVGARAERQRLLADELADGLVPLRAKVELGLDPDAVLALLEVDDVAHRVGPDPRLPGVLVEEGPGALEPVEQEVGLGAEELAVEVAADPVVTREGAEEQHPPALP